MVLISKEAKLKQLSLKFTDMKIPKGYRCSKLCNYIRNKYTQILPAVKEVSQNQLFCLLSEHNWCVREE